MTKIDRQQQEHRDGAIPFPWWRGLLVFAVLLILPVSRVSASAPGAIQLSADTVIALNSGQTLEARGHALITNGRYTIRADRALYDRKSQQIQLTGHVYVTTPQGDLTAGETAVHLTREGILDTFQASGGATVRSADRTLTADRVAYQARDDTLTATGGVVLTFPPQLNIFGMTLMAKGTDRATVIGHARVQTPTGVIEGDRLEVAVRTQIAFVNGHVVGEFEDTKITAATATVFAKEEKAIFRTGVSVKRPGRAMASDLVTYYYKQRRLIAEGRTTITLQTTSP